ncbi:MAG: MFS transporter [Gammaproteobacteria bacterium]|nr:MFS transporter [Gammaproteobacteria bacterium]
MPHAPDGTALFERSTLAKVTLRLMPFLFLLYIVAWLDRVNVGFAALQMNQDLAFNATVYGFGAGVFFAGYALFEVPSNLILVRVGARRWIARIMITWGVISAAMMFVRTPTSFYVLRFLLGVAEAGFFPGIIYYLSNWFPATQRARAVSWFMVAIPLSIVIGGPLAGLLLGMNGLLGLTGWQWLFLLEGAPAVILGIVVLFYLTENPMEARWLKPEERGWLAARIHAEQTQARERHGLGLRQALLHPTVWLLSCIMFTCQSGSYGLTLWVPQIVKGLSGLSDFQVGLISAIPYIGAAIGMMLIGMSSDRSGERFLHIAVPSIVAAIGFAASAWIGSPVPGIIALTVAAVGDLGSRGPFWALPGRFLAGPASAGGIALINTIGALGGFVGPYAVGLLKHQTGSFTGGLLLLALLLLAGAIVTLRLRRAPVLGS